MPRSTPKGMECSHRIHMYPRGGKCLLGCLFEFICLVWLGRNLTLEGGAADFQHLRRCRLINSIPLPPSLFIAEELPCSSWNVIQRPMGELYYISRLLFIRLGTSISRVVAFATKLTNHNPPTSYSPFNIKQSLRKPQLRQLLRLRHNPRLRHPNETRHRTRSRNLQPSQHQGQPFLYGSSQCSRWILVHQWSL